MKLLNLNIRGIRKILFFLLFFTSLIISSQEQKEFLQLTGENVSTQSITYSIEQDALGNVWIGSEEGVLKHNSKNFQVYNSYQGLPQNFSNRTSVVFIDSKGRIWAGFDQGVCLYNKDLDKFELIETEDEVNPSVVRAITEDENGQIWVGGHNGLWNINQNFKLNRVNSHKAIRSIYTIDDTVFFGALAGLFYFDKKELTTFEISSVKGQSVHSISKIDNALYAGTANGNLYRSQEHTINFSRVAISNNLSHPI